MYIIAYFVGSSNLIPSRSSWSSFDLVRSEIIWRSNSEMAANIFKVRLDWAELSRD